MRAVRFTQRHCACGSAVQFFPVTVAGIFAHLDCSHGLGINDYKFYRPGSTTALILTEKKSGFFEEMKRQYPGAKN